MNRSFHLCVLTALGISAGCAVLFACPERPVTDPVAASAPAARPTSRPTDLTTPAGVVLTVPDGFGATQKGPLISLEGPGKETQVHVVELERVPMERAVEAAWLLVDPGFEGRVEQVKNPPSKKGFDQVLEVTYVPDEQGRIARVQARRLAERIWVIVVRGTAASLDRRGAQIGTFLASLKPPGRAEPDLSRRLPMPILSSADALRGFIRASMATTETPGLALAIIERGKVVLTEGFGVRELGKQEPIDPDTLMMVGSTTKPMTTLLMAALVDRQKMRWSQRVVELAPDFKLGDPRLTRELLVEHMVCACAGLPRRDLPLMLNSAGKQPMAVFAELATMQPSTGLQETFQYQNQLFAAGGYLAGQAFAPGRPPARAYDRAMQELLFTPMGMTSTLLDHSSAATVANRASPHAQDLEGRHRRIDPELERFASYIRPAAGAWSTARDMARFLMTELAQGISPSGIQVASSASVTHRWQPQVALNGDTSYGLGWMIGMQHQLRTILHSGSTLGFASLIAFFPDHQLGAVLLTNGTGGHALNRAVLARLVELWFETDEKAAESLHYSVTSRNRELELLRGQLTRPAAFWLQPLEGRYRNPAIGLLEIGHKGKEAQLSVGLHRSRLRRHDRPDGKVALVFMDPPLEGFELLILPGDDADFELKRAQESYLFRRDR